MKNTYLKFALLVFLVQTAFTAHAQEKTPFDYMDVFELQYASDPQISPDGNKVVYVRNQFDLMTDRKFTNLWVLGFDGSGHQPITTGKKGSSSPRWSPDGKRLSYISGEEGSAQIFVRWMDTGQAASITNLTKSPNSLTWSPDGKWLAFLMTVPATPPSLGAYPSPPKGAEWAKPATIIDQYSYRSDGNFSFVEPGYTHIFILSAEGGAPRQLTFGDFNHGAPSWSPDSKALVFSANREENSQTDIRNTHIYELEVNSGKIKKLTTGKGPHDAPRLSPDGKSIVFSSYEDRFLGYQQAGLFVMNRDGSGKREISHNLDRDLNNIQWSNDGKSLYAQYDEHGAGKIVNIGLNGKTGPLASELGGTSFGRPYSGGSFSVANNGRFAFTQSSPHQPSEVAVGHFPTRMGIRKITDLNGTFFSGKKLGKVEEVWYKSSHDKKDIQGWIIYPPDFDPAQKYPFILEIHGGPYAAYGPHFTAELQLMATKGYVVLYTNPRGSTSYGAEFAAYINDNYPSEDYDDLLSGVDAVIAKGFIDESRLYITGGSGGGVLTAWSVGKTDRFAAAVVAKPVINWYSFSLYADGYQFFTKYWFNKMPWEDPEQYLKRSPISLVGNVTTPTMLITGEEDYRTPMAETEQYYGALKLQGVETMMVRVPGSSHSIAARPSNLIRKTAYILGWFEKYTKE